MNNTGAKEQTGENDYVYYLGDDEITKGLVTFKNDIGDAIVAVIMPANFKKVKSCTIVYETT